MTQDRIFVTDKLFDLHQTYFTPHQTVNSLSANWQFCLFFLRFFFLWYADSSNQRDFFLFGSRTLRIFPIKLVKYAWLHKKTLHEQKFFLQCSSLFLRAFVSSLLNKESMIRLIKPVVYSWCNCFTTYLLILYQITFSLLNLLKVKFHGYDKQKQSLTIAERMLLLCYFNWWTL